MSVRTSCTAPAPRLLAALSIAVVAGLASATQAVAGEDPFGVTLPRPRHPHRPGRPAAPPPVPPAAIVGGYLPRNNSVPMYNEPPRRSPAW